MITLQVIIFLLIPLLISTSQTKKSYRYAFYRQIDAPKFEETRRIFGGSATELNKYPAVCALVDRYTIVRCTGALLSKYWVLTAAHCVSPRISHIKYNSRWSNDSKSKSSPVMYLYRHPEYKVIEENVGHGVDVTLLHHDVGMMRTRDAMVLNDQSELNPIVDMKRFNPLDLKREEIMILGFGRTGLGNARDLKGEELFGVVLQLNFCDRGAWYHCVCGVPGTVGRTGGGRGVCSGDSGGPVIYRGSQIAITSMGPTDCRKMLNHTMPGATSVFTTLYQYANLINSTIFETENMLREGKLRLIPDPITDKNNASVLYNICFRLCFVFFLFDLDICKLLL